MNTIIFCNILRTEIIGKTKYYSKSSVHRTKYILKPLEFVEISVKMTIWQSDYDTKQIICLSKTK